MYKKNTAVTGFGIGHFINTTTGAAVTTGTPTCKRTLDGTGGACANAAAYNTDGAAWEIDLAAGDMNADQVILSFTLTDCLPISYTIRTVTKLVSDLQDIAAGAAMTLTSAYDAAKTAATQSSVNTVDTVVDAIKLKSDLIPASPAAVGSAMTLSDNAITSAKIADSAITSDKFTDSALVSVWQQSKGTPTAGSYGEFVGTLSTATNLAATQASVDVIDGLVDGLVALVTAARMGALTDLIDGGRLDLLIDGIKTKTDTIPASPAGVSDIPTTAQIKTEIEAAGSSLAQILEDTGTSIPALIAALNNLSDTEVVTALKASTGWTAGNTMTLAVIVKVILAFIAGNWQDGTSGYDVKDADDGTTTVLNIVPSTTTPQKTVTIS